MKHKDIPLIAATGGPGVVTAVLSSGKRGIGAGAGNPPAVVDETAGRVPVYGGASHRVSISTSFNGRSLHTSYATASATSFIIIIIPEAW